MIRYAIRKRDLEDRIDAHKDGWRERAAERTAALIAAGEFDESSSIWSEIKPVFMDVQFNKCVFCERQFEDASVGSIEHDLEHFRPKGSVKRWPSGAGADRFDFPLGEPNDTGYFWLAYDLANYAAACKICNSTLKSNAFPIALDRGVSGDVGVALRDKEKPYLCYPIGKSDQDPETLIDFVGTTARPHGRRGHKRRRAEVIIEFFRLNDRDALHFQRSKEIFMLGFALRQLNSGDTRRDWGASVDNLIADNQPHAACKRALLRRWNDDRALAERIIDAAQEAVFEQPPLADG